MQTETFDLLVSGAGDLGMRVAERFRSQNPEALIACETLSSQRHALLRSRGFVPRRSLDSPCQADGLVICFPPSTPNYLQEITRSLNSWSGKGVALLVSSTGVYEEGLQGEITEESPRKTSSLLKEAEDVTLQRGAHVLRLAGLYSENRGPHIFWENLKESKSHPKGWINLIHRDDAAQAILVLLKSKNPAQESKIPAQAWNLSDENPLTRESIAKAWASHKKIAPIHFLGLEAPNPERKILSTKFRSCFAWTPEHKNFLDFVKSLD
jgi:nucleoside-diphosphate-sugar epimerase